MSTRIRPNPIRSKATRASPRTVIDTPAKPKHTNSFVCILSIIIFYPIIISVFITSNFIRNKINSSLKIKFSNKIITINLVTYKITFFINIIFCNIRMINSFFKKIYCIIIFIFINNSYISNKCPLIKLSPLDTPSKLGRCLSPSASSFSICLLNLNKPLYISTKLKFILSLF